MATIPDQNLVTTEPAQASTATRHAAANAAAQADAAIEQASVAETELLRKVLQGAHDAIDRLAERAVPAVDRLRDRVDDAAGALKQRAGQAADSGKQLTEGLRSVVRDHPLTAIAAAVAIGALIARLTVDDDA